MLLYVLSSKVVTVMLSNSNRSVFTLSFTQLMEHMSDAASSAPTCECDCGMRERVDHTADACLEATAFRHGEHMAMTHRSALYG